MLPLFKKHGSGRLSESELLDRLRNFPRFRVVERFIRDARADVGSSLFWTLNSGSLALVMETPFESFASVHVQPFVHDVPLRVDLSDFEQRLDGCKSNDAECRAMTERAMAACQMLARHDLRDIVNRRVASTLNELCGV